MCISSELIWELNSVECLSFSVTTSVYAGLKKAHSNISTYNSQRRKNNFFLNNAYLKVNFVLHVPVLLRDHQLMLVKVEGAIFSTSM